MKEGVGKRVVWFSLMGIGLVAVVAATVFLRGGIGSGDPEPAKQQSSAGQQIPAPTAVPPPIPLSQYEGIARKAAEQLLDVLAADADQGALLAAARTAKEDLMRTTVPAQKRDAHLDLILTLARLEQAAIDADTEAFDVVRTDLEDAVNTFLEQL